MRRILICECKQEISSFNPVAGQYEDFEIGHGQDLLTYHRGIGTEVGGALSVFDEAGVRVIPGYSARAITSGGTVAAEAFERISREFLHAVRHAGHLEGVYLSLHGAMAAETEEDVEGFLVEQTRKIVGDSIPLVVSLDLHGILTDRILTYSDAVVLYHTYPHVDFFQTGHRSARLLLRLIEEDLNPVSVRVRIPALVRGYELITETGMFGRCVRRAVMVENSPGGLSGGMFIGNPFTDVTDLCSNVLLVTDDDLEMAQEEAVSIAEEFWSMRQHLQQPLTPLLESARMAADAAGRIVLVDAADATSSGASGDSNAILRALVEVGCKRRALIPIVDAPAVEAAIAAGVGATVTVPVGGSLDPGRFTPLEVTGQVRLISDGRLWSESHGGHWYAGRTVVLECGPNTLVLTSRPVSLYDRTLFLGNAQDPASFDINIVKSPHCQPRFFADGAERLINVDAPGSTSANLKSLGHTRCRRPVFPLDDNVSFTPEVQVFRRNRR